MTPTLAIVGVVIFLAAQLYSCVGHAGASGYLAVMGLCGVSAALMKPTALIPRPGSDGCLTAPSPAR